MAIMVRRASSNARWCVLTIPFLLQACAGRPPPPPVPGPPEYAADLTGGARQCHATEPRLKDGQEVTVSMQVGNDGGWCAIPVARDGKPYAAGLLTVPASHGTVFIHPVGNETRIDYTPAPGFTGTDAFTVKLIPGYPALRVMVSVTR